MTEYNMRGADVTDPLKMIHDLRDADLEEMNALGYYDSVEALMISIAHSEISVVDTVDGVPECFAGVCKGGIIWCVTTEEYMRDHVRRFFEVSQKFMEISKTGYPVLWNFVYSGNTKHIRWLKRMGFEILEEQPHGPYGKPFRKFKLMRSG